MDLKIKILGTERTNEGKNRFVIKIDDKDITSILLSDNEIQSISTAKASLISQLKSKNYVGSEFTITI